ncbi:MAG: hypothetical protein KAX49_18565 [Halanaerobiales bacterium]|nr:hypothetical protein [Halanaerobiales bacterium]
MKVIYKRLFSENKNIKAKIKQQLQIILDKGTIICSF